MKKQKVSAKDIPQDAIEVMYGMAYRFFQAGKVQDALNMFTFLCQLRPNTFLYLFGLATAYHKLQRFAEASDIYMKSSQCEPDNPLPYFHLYDSLKQLGKDKDANLALEICVSRCGDNPLYQPVKGKAELMLGQHNNT